MATQKRGQASPGLITAAEIACFAYCPEQWRLQYGLGLPAGNRQAMAAVKRQDGRMAAMENFGKEVVG